MADCTTHPYASTKLLTECKGQQNLSQA